MAINNPYIPGDPFSYDLKWIVAKIKEHSVSIQANSTAIDSLEERIPTLEEIKEYLQQAASSGKLSFITPEMLGAFGDGEHDDTEAFQAAVDINFPIVCTSGKTYKLRQIYLVDGTDIDANGASFIAAEPILFYAAGEAVNYGATASQYISGNRQVDLTFSPAGGNLIQIIDESYTYRTDSNGTDYKAGGLCEIDTEGSTPTITPPIPFTMTSGASVTEYKPITIKIENVAGITFDNVPEAVSAIYLLANKNSIIYNVCVEGASRSLVTLNHCYNVQIIDCKLSSSYVPPELYYYLVSIGGGSYHTVIQNCTLQSTWHAITEVGYIPVMHSIVTSCIIKCSTNYPALMSHDCSIDLTVVNSEMDGAEVTNSAYFENCFVYDRGDGGEAAITIIADSNASNKWDYQFHDIKFLAKSTTPAGIKVTSASSGTVNRLILDNVYGQSDLNIVSVLPGANLTTINELVIKGKFVYISGLSSANTIINNLMMENVEHHGKFIVAAGVLKNAKIVNLTQQNTGSDFSLYCEKLMMTNARFFNPSGSGANMNVNADVAELNNIVLEDNGVLYVSATANVMIANSQIFIPTIALGRKLSATNCVINGQPSTNIMIDRTTSQLCRVNVVNGAMTVVALN